MSQGSCVLHNLDNPLLAGVSLGLAFTKEQTLSLSPQMFPCCKGNGFAWDSRSYGYHACNLKARLFRLQDILNRYTRTFPSTTRFPYQVTPAWSHQVLQELAAVFRHDRPPASISYTTQRNQPSMLWTKAFAAVWRFGMDVRIARLTDFNPVELATLTAGTDKPFAIFIDQVDKLWDPGIVEAVEYVVQQAYNAQAFLWIEFVHDQSTGPDESDGTVRGNIARKLQKLKDKHPLDLLSRDCLSRLQGLSGIKHHSGNAPNA
ncbi:MAG: hypothetical protein H7249_16085 [Chitinophagaceae bacterium]|nr:hypothetical protein [Oligoflexus sp.]